jgi:M6 family metalloprotease-like protein
VQTPKAEAIQHNDDYSESIQRTPSVGTAKILAIMIDFDDQEGLKTANDFEELLFGNSFGSLKHYYSEVSYGLLSISRIISPRGGHRSATNMTVRGDDTVPNNPDHVDDANGDIYDLVKEALILANGDLNYSLYDSDHDGLAEDYEASLCIIARAHVMPKCLVCI